MLVEGCKSQSRKTSGCCRPNAERRPHQQCFPERLKFAKSLELSISLSHTHPKKATLSGEGGVS